MVLFCAVLRLLTHVSCILPDVFCVCLSNHLAQLYTMSSVCSPCVGLSQGQQMDTTLWLYSGAIVHGP